jgi:hypothetical protein
MRTKSVTGARLKIARELKKLRTVMYGPTGDPTKTMAARSIVKRKVKATGIPRASRTIKGPNMSSNAIYHSKSVTSADFRRIQPFVASPKPDDSNYSFALLNLPRDPITNYYLWLDCGEVTFLL